MKTSGSTKLKAATPIDTFLASSAYCCSDHPIVVETMRSIVGEETRAREVAVRLFEWVRDNVAYCVGNWNRRAWETLLSAEGSCSNKANVLVAMLRAAGIAAGFRVMSVDATKYWGIGVPSWICQGFSRSSVHVYVSVLLDGRWVKCDPSDDRVLSENVGHLNPVSRLVEFDGRHDAVLPFAPEHVYSDEGVLASVDDLLVKEMKADPAQVEMMNLMLRYARRVGRAYSDLAAIQTAFFEHVREHSPALLARFYTSVGAETLAGLTAPSPPPSATRISTRLRVVPRVRD